MDQCVGCGATTIEFPEDRSTWDVRTDTVDGVECVVERSVCVRCPECGVTSRSLYDGPHTVLMNCRVEVVDPPVPVAS